MNHPLIFITHIHVASSNFSSNSIDNNPLTWRKAKRTKSNKPGGFLKKITNLFGKLTFEKKDERKRKRSPQNQLPIFKYRFLFRRKSVFRAPKLVPALTYNSFENLNDEEKPSCEIEWNRGRVIEVNGEKYYYDNPYVSVKPFEPRFEDDFSKD
ncbi:unnamed protein product [Gordionus sp. m RMFG-2023]